MGSEMCIRDSHKSEALPLVRELDKAGCRLYATEGTAAMISAMGLPVTMATKRLDEGHPNVLDVINEDSVGAVINTLSGEESVLRDGFYIRRAAVERQIPCFTALDTARAAVGSLLTAKETYRIRSIREYLDAS